MVFSRETQIRVCVRDNDGDIIRIRFDRGLNFWTSSFTVKHRVSQFRTARRDGVYQFPQSISEHLSRNLTNRFQRRSMRDLRIEEDE